MQQQHDTPRSGGDRLDAYEGMLSEHHRQLLAESAISPEVANRRGYREVTDRAQLERSGYSERQRRKDMIPGLLIPLWTVTGQCEGSQYRPDRPREKAGRAVKYETPSDMGARLDVHPFAKRDLGNPRKPLLLTEGIRKGDAAVSAGACAVALLGVWNWRGRNRDDGLTALSDWESVHLKGRAVFLVFDSDVMLKLAVHKALVRLGAFLAGRGAQVGYVYLPPGADLAKVGLDDWLAAGNDIRDLPSLASADPRPPVAANGGEDTRAMLPPPSRPMDVARVLVGSHTVDALLTLRMWRGGWMRWRRTHWVEIETGWVRSWIYRETESACYLLDGTREPWAPNRHKVADVMDALAAICLLSDDHQPPMWTTGDPPAGPFIAVQNGLLHVHSGELLPHSPAYFNTNAVPFAYDAGAPEPADWLKFLDMLWSDDDLARDALQEWFGYVLSGRTDLQKILLLVGPTRAGKGTIVRVLETLVGRANTAGPTLSSLATNFGLSPLLGKSLAVVADARLGGANVFQVVERLLSISGEDTQTVDRKYREPWTGRLGTRFMVVSNELPNLGDASGTIAHRFVPLVLIQSWLGKEDGELGNRLAAESAGILNWSLRGLERLLANGRFTTPESAAQIIVDMKDAASPVSAFVRDRCVVAPGAEITVDALYHGWRAWCIDNGRERISTKQTFGRDLRAVAPGVRVIRPRGEADERQRRYGGITLVGQHGAPPDPHWTGPRTTADRADDDDDGEAGTGPVRDGPRSDPMSSVLEPECCDGGPRLPRCRLCKRSDTYWRERT